MREGLIKYFGFVVIKLIKNKICNTFMTHIIDGKALAESIKKTIKEKVAALKIKPGLAVILVGSNDASQVYVASKERACLEVGFYSEKYTLKETIKEAELLKLIAKLNKQKNIHAILVQLPLPNHIDEFKVLSAVVPEKDVDGFHPVNLGSLVTGKDTCIPCTPKGVLRLIESVTSIEGKHAVVVGRSNIVGKPVALLLLQKNATVTMCHSKTKNLSEFTKQADILVVAVGKAQLIKKNMVKKGAVVIDVGINSIDGKLTGDIAFEEVSKVAGHITRVPGGVGPMTIAMLLENTLELYERNK